METKNGIVREIKQRPGMPFGGPGTTCNDNHYGDCLESNLALANWLLKNGKLSIHNVQKAQAQVPTKPKTGSFSKMGGVSMTKLFNQ